MVAVLYAVQMQWAREILKIPGQLKIHIFLEIEFFIKIFSVKIFIPLNLFEF